MYKNIFIDLDRTLWDFEANSRETLEEIFTVYKLNKYSKFDIFHREYVQNNDLLWEEYRNNMISRDLLTWKRFFLSLEKIGISDEELAKKIGIDYLEINPAKTILIPHAREILEYLHDKYRIFLITNGFKEIQYKKIRNCDIDKYFEKVYTSEEVGHNKPHPAFFEHVLKDTGSTSKESIVIGDDMEIDILGASNLNIATIWYNPDELKSEFMPTFEIKCLSMIPDIL